MRVWANSGAFKRHLGSRRGQALIGIFAVILVLRFAGPKDREGPPFAAPARALAQAPFATVGQIARLDFEQLRIRLAAAGLHPYSDRQRLSELVGPDLRAQIRVLGVGLPAQP